ncbi:hypothetical protein [Actinoplanes regularis]|uniref:Gram-positive cocci surface proteins LPxTG domain-containing protein n=1 Tax=Actinoplanes regularis TaxID=52697 RepID=A0A239BBH7_9ACTN|nr:hypothetical protein [Actinoplanes regularis]SNS04524.1 hypothetical protein SAMN06264365_10955 [Actinoplanes regularis]
MRLIVSTAVAVMIMALTPLPAVAARAAAVFVEVNPSTVPAGDEVSLRASCDDNLKAATVSAEPIGSVPVKPEFGFLIATAKVPAGQRAGAYKITLTCPDGKTASTTLHVVAKVEPSRGPATGGGGTAPERTASLLIGGGLAAMLVAAGLAVLALRRRRLG